MDLSISKAEWCFLHDTGEKSTLANFFSIECRKTFCKIQIIYLRFGGHLYNDCCTI